MYTYINIWIYICVYVYIYIHLCMYICVHICIYIHYIFVYIQIFLSEYIRRHICNWIRYIYMHIYISIHVCIYICICIFTHIYGYANIHIYMYIYLSLSLSLSICMYIYICARARARTRTRTRAHTLTHTHTHTHTLTHTHRLTHEPSWHWTRRCTNKYSPLPSLTLPHLSLQRLSTLLSPITGRWPPRHLANRAPMPTSVHFSRVASVKYRWSSGWLACQDPTIRIFPCTPHSCFLQRRVRVGERRLRSESHCLFTILLPLRRKRRGSRSNPSLPACFCFRCTGLRGGDKRSGCTAQILGGWQRWQRPGQDTTWVGHDQGWRLSWLWLNDAHCLLILKLRDWRIHTIVPFRRCSDCQSWSNPNVAATRMVFINGPMCVMHMIFVVSSVFVYMHEYIWVCV